LEWAAIYSVSLSRLSIGLSFKLNQQSDLISFNLSLNATIAAMRTAFCLVAVLFVAISARADVPSTRPSNAPILIRKRPVLTMQQATKALGLIGPVTKANYSRTFEPPTIDPMQPFRDRYNYGIPAYSPYLFYGAYFPYYRGYGFGFGCGYWPGISGTFYGD
jgi:hypothetical protein